MNNITLIGIDLSKYIFQLCGLNKANKVQFNRAITRTKLVDQIRQYPNAKLVMEACASAHHWARVFTEMGHEVSLIPAQHVKALTRGNKSDVHDALAIAESASRPNIHPVNIKTIEQQDYQTLLRIRMQYKAQRTQTVNQARGLMAEYGEILPKTMNAFSRGVQHILEDPQTGLTPISRDAIHNLYHQYNMLTKQINDIESQINQIVKQHSLMKSLLRVRGIGPITAMALFASIGKATQFKNARQLSAWIGLVPKQYGSGGKMTLGSISKRGNQYLRMLLIHGAHSVMNWMKNKTDAFSLWVKQLMSRCGKHKAIVAIANKTARMVWVVMHKGLEHLPKQHLSAT